MSRSETYRQYIQRGEGLPDSAQTCLIFAARHAHKRNTTAAWVVVTEVLDNWERLSPRTRGQIAREAKSEATCNHDEWAKIIEREG